VLLAVSEGAGGPWDVRELRKAPKFEVVERKANLSSLYYECEPFQGKPTRVFAYLAYPEKASGRSPGIVLVHGGGGQAFAEWARMWADRGYVALAMDLEGHGPDGKTPVEPWPAERYLVAVVKDLWPYHAVAAVIRGISLLASLPEVDPTRIGITGISWGGYLTCIVAGLDDRLKAAVPVYGCGFLTEGTKFEELLDKLTEDQRKAWITNFDPSNYLGRCRMPVLFVNGTNDLAYWLGAYQMSYRLVRRRTLCITVNMLHSHPHGWAPVEIGLFIDQILKGGEPLPSIRSAKRDGRRVDVRFASKTPLEKAALHYTTDTGIWPERKWQTIEAKVSGSTATAELPPARPITYFLTLTDTSGATVSTEHETVGDGRASPH